MDPDKVQAMLDYPSPQNRKELERFLGLAGWYANFIPNFTDLSAPLNDLRVKDKLWDWSEKCEESFQMLKQKLMSPDLLAFPDLIRPFQNICDYSGTDNQLQNGEFRPISYASRKFKPAERNYSPTEGECLAVVWSLEKWKPYVLDQLCQVYTDHEAIYWLWYKAELSGRLIRWILRMQEFNLQIFHKPGKEMIVPDALSRMFGGTQIKQEGKDSQEIDYPEDEEEEPSSEKFPIKIIGSVSETCDAKECKSRKGKVINWIQCDSCGKWLHMVCVGRKKKASDRIEFYTCSGCKESAGNSDLNDEITVEATRLNQLFIKDIEVALLEFSPIIEFLQENRLPVNKKLAKQIQNVAKSYSYENGLLYKLTKGNKRVIVIPKKLRISFSSNA